MQESASHHCALPSFKAVPQGSGTESLWEGRRGLYLSMEPIVGDKRKVPTKMHWRVAQHVSAVGVSSFVQQHFDCTKRAAAIKL